MKPETLIYDKVRAIIPNGSEKTTFFAAVGATSYEIFFYALIDGKQKQCFELAEQGLLDENELDSVFGAIADIIKDSKLFKTDKCNVATITIDRTGVKMDVEYHEKDARMYKIKKEWEDIHITP